jgi:hypothetical protein
LPFFLFATFSSSSLFVQTERLFVSFHSFNTVASYHGAIEITNDDGKPKSRLSAFFKDEQNLVPC